MRHRWDIDETVGTLVRLMMLIRLSSWVQSVTVLNCPVSPLSSLLSSLCAPLSSHQYLSTTPLSTSFTISTHPSLFFVLITSSFSSHSPHEFDCFSPSFSFSFFSFRCWSHWCRIPHGSPASFDAAAACAFQRHSSPLFQCDIVFLLDVTLVLRFPALWNSSSFFFFMTLQLWQVSSSASLLPVQMRCHCFEAMTVACCKWARQPSEDVVAFSALS